MAESIKTLTGIMPYKGSDDILRLMLENEAGEKSELLLDSKSAPMLVGGTIIHSKPFQSFGLPGIEIVEALNGILSSYSPKESASAI